MDYCTVIEGKTAAQVAHAKRRVEMVAWTNRFKEEPTHFLSIPLTAPGVKEKVREFKERVLLTCGKVRYNYDFIINCFTFVYQ